MCYVFFHSQLLLDKLVLSIALPYVPVRQQCDPRLLAVATKYDIAVKYFDYIREEATLMTIINYY